MLILRRKRGKGERERKHQNNDQKLNSNCKAQTWVFNVIDVVEDRNKHPIEWKSFNAQIEKKKNVQTSKRNR